MFTSWKRPAIIGFVVLVLSGFSNTADACLWGLFGNWGSGGCCGWSGCGYDSGCGGGYGYGCGGYGYSGGYSGYGSGCGCYAAIYSPFYATGSVATVSATSYPVVPTCCAPSAVRLTPAVAVHNAGPTCCGVELASYTTRAAVAQSARDLERGVVTVHAVYRTVKTETPAQLASDSDNLSRTLQFCKNVRRWNLR